MKNEVLQAYACYNKDESIRRISTSGGMFYLIASYIIEYYHGKVCGAAFDQCYNVSHRIVDNIDDLKCLLGSKYPQSRMGTVYRDIKELLLENNVVLFCGTPCQVEGLLSYLGKKSSTLWLIDFVCHGVASPGIWQEYLNKKTKSEKIEAVAFKDKKYGWKHWHVHIKTENREYFEDASSNLFMQSYLSRVNIRPCCYECRFKGLDRISDFTLADCWGVGEENKSLNDDKGLSALIIHTNRALDLFNCYKDRIVSIEYDPDILMSANWAAIKQTERSPKREGFFDYMSSHSANSALSHYFKRSVLLRMRNKLILYWKRIVR